MSKSSGSALCRFMDPLPADGRKDCAPLYRTFVPFARPGEFHCWAFSLSQLTPAGWDGALPDGVTDQAASPSRLKR